MNDVACARKERVDCRLLLECMRADLEGLPCASLPALVSEVSDNWGTVRETARRHGLLPVLCRFIAEAPPSLVPGGLQAAALSDLRVNVARGLSAVGEFLRVAEALTRSRIRALPFKGPLLGACLYGSPCLREFSDLDILIDRRDAPRAGAVLSGCGYTPEKPWRAGRNGLHVAWRSAVGSVAVELQWDLGRRWQLTPAAGLPPLDFGCLWENRTYAKVCGLLVPGLGPEDLLIVLCVHGSRHNWCRLVWILDVALLLRRHPDLDWGRVLQMAARFNCRRRLHVTLDLASSLFGVELPEPVRRTALRDPAAAAVSANVRRRVIPVEASGPADAGVRDSAECTEDLDRVALFASVHEYRRDRLRIWLCFLRDRMRPDAGARPSILAPLDWLIRVARLLRKYGPQPAIRLLRLLRAQAL
jgi:hypothetical protein